MTPKAILFDLDGVLVKSEEAWFKTMEAAGVRFRGSPVTREEFLPTFGQGAEEDVAQFGLACTPEELNAFFVEQFKTRGQEVWVDPDAAPLLRGLKEMGLLAAVVTNSNRPIAQAVLEGGGLWELLGTVACADEAGRSKPAPDVLFLACARLGITPQEAWMVGDSRYDREAAASAGAKFVGFKLDAGPGGIRVESLSEILSLVKRPASR